MARHCLDNGLQAKAADRRQAPSLSFFPANQNLGRPGRYR